MKTIKGHQKMIWNVVKKPFDKCKDSKLYILIIISIIAILILLILYFVIPSSKTNWSKLDSLVSSITGLLAFIGVLFAINQSNSRMKEAEARTCYNNAVDTYYKTVENVKCFQKSGSEALSRFAFKIKQDWAFTVISNNFNKSLNNPNLEKEDEARKPIEYINKRIKENNSEKYDNNLPLEELYFKTESLMSDIPFHHSLLEYIKLQDNLDVLVRDSVLITAKRLFLENEYYQFDNSIERYCQVVFATLEKLEKLDEEDEKKKKKEKEKTNWAKSYCEFILDTDAIILFLYSMSPKAPKKYIDLFNQQELYNKISVTDLPLCKSKNKVKDEDIKKTFEAIFQKKSLMST